ncbi:hypothetical protein PACTADRAFT_49265 [Pachysolen tannophilus NRRL Y-2460]|uniref:Uncharacterized protein n=1 Tax=Pachysolen tannophilus NRRL Y-2460 TaxID=669874 RepID=A0A1E4TVY5_PACTA|nr:hypothetical protein PACTADRAFT_49265 [Pachysolen tannophilus NRRL Y-2460]
MSAQIPTSKSFWRQAAFLTSIALFTAYFVKSKIHLRRQQQFRPDELESSSYYSDGSSNKNQERQDISKIRPGFPTSENSEYMRKSQYEGSGNSYISRRSGDKISSGFWGKWW